MPNIEHLKLIIEAEDRAKEVIENFNTRLGNIGKKIEGVGKSISAYVSMPLMASGMASLKLAGNFDDAVRQVNVMLKASQKDLEWYKKELLRIARETAIAPEQVANAWYQIVSAGFRGKESIEVLEVALKGAVGGAADAAQTTAALTKAMNIFGFEGAEGASRAMDTFFGIVDQGLLTFEELSMYFPIAAQNAAALGMSIEETGAALATLTKVSGSTAEAATSLNALLMGLVKPSEKLQELFEEWGVKNGPEAIKKFGGLAGVLEKVKEATKGNIDELAKLFPNIRAIRGGLPLITTNAEDFKNALEALNSTSGRTNQAFNEMAQGSGFLVKKVFNELKVASIETGETLAKNLEKPLLGLINKVGELAKKFGELPEGLQKAIVYGMALSVVAGFGTTYLGKFIQVIYGLSSALAFLVANPMAAAIGAIILFFTWIGICLWKWDRFRENIILAAKVIRYVLKKVFEFIGTKILEFIENVKAGLEIAKFNISLWIEEAKEKWRNFKETISSIWNKLVNAIKTGIDKIKGFFQGLYNFAKKIKDEILSFVDKIRGAFEKVGEIIEKSPLGKVLNKIGGKIEELKKAASEIGKGGGWKEVGGGKSINITITGNTLLDQESAEKIGNLIVERLKLIKNF